MPNNPVTKLHLHECLSTHRHTGACFSNSSIDVEFERELIRLFGIDKDDALSQLYLDPTVRFCREVVGEVAHFFGKDLPLSEFVQSKLKGRFKKGRRRPKTADKPLVVVDAYDLPLTVERDTPALKVREHCECPDGHTCIVCCTSMDLLAFPEFKGVERVRIGEDKFQVLVPVEIAEELGLEWEKR